MFVRNCVAGAELEFGLGFEARKRAPEEGSLAGIRIGYTEVADTLESFRKCDVLSRTI